MKREEVRLTIHPMNRADLDEVIAIEQVSYSKPWKREMFEAELEGNAFARFFVARDPDQNTILGHICFWIVFEEMHLMNLAVHPARRRQGIGEQLARWAMAWVKDQGVGLATLEVRASNEAAKQLYEKLGFRVAAVRSAYYREPKEDALIMNLSQ